MRKHLKLFVYSVLAVLAFVFPQMLLSQAMEETTPITLAQPDGKEIVMKVYLNQSLSDLRSELINKNRIVPDDIFQRGGIDIFRDDEKYCTISDVIVDNILSLKPRNSVSTQLFGNTDITQRAAENLRQETEQKERLEKVALWSAGIEVTILHFKDLLNYNLTYGALLEVLEPMKAYYMDEALSAIGETLASDYRLGYSYEDGIAYMVKSIAWIRYPVGNLTNGTVGGPEFLKRGRGSKEYQYQMVDACLAWVRRNLGQKLMIYRDLQGTAHPYWDEFARS
jgi:hypothetical protein